MKVKYSKYLPLFSVVFIRKDETLTATDLNHEYIHTMQGKELLWIFFYLFYGLEYIIRLIQYRNRKKAYYNISFEREAYGNQNNLLYTRNRKRYNFIKYIIKSNKKSFN